MPEKKFSVRIASVPDREKVIAEIFYEDDQWAEISQENEDNLLVAFFPPSNSKFWEFPLNEALSTLEYAKKILLEA